MFEGCFRWVQDSDLTGFRSLLAGRSLPARFASSGWEAAGGSHAPLRAACLFSGFDKNTFNCLFPTIWSSRAWMCFSLSSLEFIELPGYLSFIVSIKFTNNVGRFSAFSPFPLPHRWDCSRAGRRLSDRRGASLFLGAFSPCASVWRVSTLLVTSRPAIFSMASNLKPIW